VHIYKREGIKGNFEWGRGGAPENNVTATVESKWLQFALEKVGSNGSPPPPFALCSLAFIPYPVLSLYL